MSLSPKYSSVWYKVDKNYEKKKRASSLRWIFVNGVLFVIFAYDLCCKCSEFTTLFHYIEMFLTVVLGANVLQHAIRLAPALWSSKPSPCTSPEPRVLPAPTTPDMNGTWPPESLARPWRLASPSPSPSPPSSPPRTPLSPVSSRSPNSPQSPYSPQSGRRDEFIADRRALAEYLKQCELSQLEPNECRAGPALPGMTGGEMLPTPYLQSYHLSPLNKEESSGVGEDGGRSSRSPPQALRRLHLDPQQLTQFHLNLRRWIQITILERVVREVDRLDSLLASAGAETRVGAASLDRLKAAATGAPGAAPVLAGLLAFLDPFPDQRYFVQRLRDLSRGGCLSGYRWDGGGAEWEDSRPTDAELVLHLFASYLDVQLPGGGSLAGTVRRTFTTSHITSAPEPAPRGPRALGIHRVTRRPPHYVVALPDDTIEVCRGRDNLPLTLLVWIAACAREDPPALHRVHLGPAGLNLLWVIGR